MSRLDQRKSLVLIALAATLLCFYAISLGVSKSLGLGACIFGMWVPTVLVFGMVKLIMLRLAGLQIRVFSMGPPSCGVCRLHYRGVTYILSAFPIYPFIYYDGLLPWEVSDLPAAHKGTRSPSVSKQVLGSLIGTLSMAILLIPCCSVLRYRSHWVRLGHVGVTHLAEESPLASLGLRTGDVIVQVGTWKVRNDRQLRAALSAYADEPTELLVLRADEFLPPIKVQLPRIRMQGRAYLGMSVTRVPEKETARIVWVRSGSPAALAGIEPEDTIERIDGQEFKTVGDMLRHLKTKGLSEVSLLLRKKDGSSVPVDIQIGKSRRFTGGVLGCALSLSDSMTKVRGARITHVFPDSPASLCGLRRNDVVLEVDGQEFNSVHDLIERLVRAIGKEIPMTLLRQKEKIQVTIKPRAEQPGPTGICLMPYPEDVTGIRQAIREGVLYSGYLLAGPFLTTGRTIHESLLPSPVSYVYVNPMFSFALAMRTSGTRQDVLLWGIAGVLGLLTFFEYIFSLYLLATLWVTGTYRCLTIAIVVFAAVSVLFSVGYFEFYRFLAADDCLRSLLSGWEI